MKIVVAKLISILRAHNRRSRAPVTALSRCRGRRPFKTLAATLLSSRTLDQTTLLACRKLFRVARKPADLKNISLRELEKLIYPVGFYRVKARQLKKLPLVLEKEFGGRIPDTVEKLMRLPGVGRKTANLVAASVFGRDEICVDTHVHRISNRLGLVKTRSPRATEQALKRVIPRQFWRALNQLLVAFGQTVCRPLKPQCTHCPLQNSCGGACKYFSKTACKLGGRII